MGWVSISHRKAGFDRIVTGISLFCEVRCAILTVCGGLKKINARSLIDTNTL